MSEKLQKNLLSLMTEVQLNAEELSRRIGVTASTIKKIRNNSDTNPTLSTLVPIAEYFSLSVSQLIGDEPFPPSRIKGSYQPPQKALSQIPLISWQDALLWPAKSIPIQSTVATEFTYGKAAFALKVEEDNLENLAKGTILLIEPHIKHEHRDFVIVNKSGQKVPTVKQVLFDEGGIYLKPLVQGRKVALLSPEHKCLGVVVEYIKQLRTSS